MFAVLLGLRDAVEQTWSIAVIVERGEELQVAAIAAEQYAGEVNEAVDGFFQRREFAGGMAIAMFHLAVVLEKGLRSTDLWIEAKTSKIHAAHKIFDKKTGGYFNGQCIVFLLLVTPIVTLPVGFCFYRSDPKQMAWRKEDERLKRLGVKKSERPAPPALDPAYPNKAEIVLRLIEKFCAAHPEVKVNAGARKSWPPSVARDCTSALTARNGLSSHCSTQEKQRIAIWSPRI